MITFQAAGHYHATMRWKTREKIIFFHDSKNLDSNKLAETHSSVFDLHMEIEFFKPNCKRFVDRFVGRILKFRMGN